MKKFQLLLTIIIGVIFLFPGVPTAFAKGPPPDYYVDESKLPFDALPETDTQRFWGTHKGAGYRIEVPKDWNGELVLYCHGYRGDGLELTVSNPSIRSLLVSEGYAWAASSYSKNAYDVKAGVKDTHALAMRFNGLVGKPSRRYIIGHSMGGHITAVSIEQYPNVYEGALPMCGVMGDNELFDYFMDYHLVALYLTGMDVEPPFPEDYTDVTVPAMQAILGQSDPSPVPYPYGLSSSGQQLKTALKYLSGGDRPIYDVGFVYYANFLFGQIMDPDNVENMDTFYHLDDDVDEISEEEATLNDEIYRGEALPKVRKPNGLANVPAISGNISIPVISMHTLGDLFVPFVMQQIYAERVETQGKSDLLVQRAIRDAGHCGFTTSEQEEAFLDLVTWVEDSIRPAGDDVVDPDVVDEWDYGCTFTSEDRSYAVPCPL